MQTVLIILNPMDHTEYIDIGNTNIPINVGDIFYQECSMKVHGIEINLNHSIRFVYVELVFGFVMEKELTENITGFEIKTFNSHKSTYLKEHSKHTKSDWSIHKNLDDFLTIADNLESEEGKNSSRAKAIRYLVARLKKAEE